MKPWQSGGCGAGQVPAPRGSKLKSCHNKSLGYWVLLYNLQFARDTTQKYFCANDRVFFKLGGYFQESQLNNVLAWAAGRWYTAAVCGTRAIIRWNDNGAKNSDYDTEGAGLGLGLGRAARMLIQPHRTQSAYLTSPQLAHSEMVDTTSFSVNLSVRAMEYIHTTNGDSPVAMSCLHHLHLHLHRYFWINISPCSLVLLIETFYRRQMLSLLYTLMTAKHYWL